MKAHSAKAVRADTHSHFREVIKAVGISRVKALYEDRLVMVTMDGYTEGIRDAIEEFEGSR